MQGSITADRAPLRWFKRSPNRGTRQHERYPCCIQGSLVIRDRNYRIEGLIMEVSRGGILFREASRFILDRVGTAVTVQSADLSAPGTIVNVRSAGYGIRLDQLLDDAFVDDLVARFGVK
jgi:hypothetical protein